MAKAHDHTGKKFGKLTAVERVGSSKRSAAIWLCHCDCGGTHEVEAQNLVHSRVKSCGCIGGIKDLAGKRFGRLEALEYVSTNGCGAACWRCRCDCGNEKIIAASSLKHHGVVSCGCHRKNPRKKWGLGQSRRTMTYCPPPSLEELEEMDW